MDEGVPASFVMVVTPAVGTQRHPELDVRLDAGVLPATFLHGLDDAGCGFVNLIPTKVFVVNDALLGFGRCYGNERAHAVVILD